MIPTEKIRLGSSCPGPAPKRIKKSSSVFESDHDSNNVGERSKGFSNLPSLGRISPEASCSQGDVDMLDEEEDLKHYITGSF